MNILSHSDLKYEQNKIASISISEYWLGRAIKRLKKLDFLNSMLTFNQNQNVQHFSVIIQTCLFNKNIFSVILLSKQDVINVA